MKSKMRTHLEQIMNVKLPAMRKSAANAISRPPPRAAPSIAAIVGIGNDFKNLGKKLNCRNYSAFCCIVNIQISRRYITEQRKKTYLSPLILKIRFLIHEQKHQLL